MEAYAFEIIGYRLYVFKDKKRIDTLQFERLEDVVRKYEWAIRNGYDVSAERIERIVIE